MAVNTTPIKSNTWGGGAIDSSLFASCCQGDPTGRLLQWRGREVHSSPLAYVLFNQLGVNATLRGNFRNITCLYVKDREQSPKKLEL